VGIFIAVLTALVIFGGIKRIATTATYVVPFMALAYMLFALVVIVSNLTRIPAVFSLIFQSAMGVEGLAGGVLGATVQAAFRYGTARGLFSNEAGQGSTAILHASADVYHPATQGISGMFGVFIDTLVICTSTTFIILLSGQQVLGDTGIELVQSSVNVFAGTIGPYFIMIAIFLFAWTSLLANVYHSEYGVRYMTKNNKNIIMVMRGVMILFVVIGSMVPTDLMWELADFFNALLIFPNVIGLLLLSGLVVKILKDYEGQVKLGKDPVWDFNTDIKSYMKKKE
jgi:AGCS family alanine or glycine:cation symporter